MLRSRFALLVLLVLGLASPAGGQASPSTPPAPADDRPHPGDILRLQIWREPELSGEFTIDEHGVVVLPKLGRVTVTNQSPAALEARLVREYARFLQHSSIDVTLLRRLQVLGAVQKPGLYPVDATMNVADALALAGGATTAGDPHRVQLVRDGKRTGVKLTASTTLEGIRIQSGDQLFVPERSWITRNSGVVAAGMTATASLIIAFLTR